MDNQGDSVHPFIGIVRCRLMLCFLRLIYRLRDALAEVIVVDLLGRYA